MGTDSSSPVTRSTTVHRRPGTDTCGSGCASRTIAELAAACAGLGFGDVAVDELLTPHARPVLTIDDDVLALILRTAEYEERSDSIALGEMTVLVGDHSVLSIRHGTASSLTD